METGVLQSPLNRTKVLKKGSDPLNSEHISGQTIECGKNCTIRIDKVLDEQTGQIKRHMHWSCRGDEGACGEDGEPSHGGTWEDAPEKVKQCARQHGFNGQEAPVPDNGNEEMENAAAAAAGAGLLYWIISEGSRLFPPRNLVPIP